MSYAKRLRTILDGLNALPFQQNLTTIKLDSMTPMRLLQTTSDVLGWIQGATEPLDIRSESSDETAIRLLRALRVLKYSPPRDIDQIQKWRLGILEGEKEVLFPILEWVFENVDRLKERVYLASYLTKVDVPREEQSPDVERLMQLVEERMQHFKELHVRIVETRADYMRAEDIRQDLKSMEEEREQLMRRIERSKRKVAKRKDLQRALQLASKLREASEQNQELQLQRQEQRNAVIAEQQRLGRLEKALAELKNEGKTRNDPTALVEKMRQESEVNRYLLEEKLPHDIEHAKRAIADGRQIAGMHDVSNEHIDQLQAKADFLRAEVEEMARKKDGGVDQSGNNELRNGKDEAAVEEGAPVDPLLLYRQQYSNMQKRKGKMAEELQASRRQFEGLETELSRRRRELTQRSAGSGVEVVSSVQYKQFVNKLRAKNNTYKRMKAELDECRAELQILERTVEMLAQRFDEVKEENRLDGRTVIEQMPSNGATIAQERPRTAKPPTMDVSRLKTMVEELNQQLVERNAAIKRLGEKISHFHAAHKTDNERYYAKRSELEVLERQDAQEQKELDQKLTTLEQQLGLSKAQVEKNKQMLTKQRWFLDNLQHHEKCRQTMRALENHHLECLKSISELNKQLGSLMEKEGNREQKQFWESLVKLLSLKIRSFQGHADKDMPMGDGRFFNSS